PFHFSDFGDKTMETMRPSAIGAFSTVAYWAVAATTFSKTAFHWSLKLISLPWNIMLILTLSFLLKKAMAWRILISRSWSSMCGLIRICFKCVTCWCFLTLRSFFCWSYLYLLKSMIRHTGGA